MSGLVRRLARPVRAAVAELRHPVESPARPAVRPAGVRLLIGPANFAGQGWAWARAVERQLVDVSAQAFAVRNERLDYRADYAVSRETFTSARWQRQQRAHVTGSYSHVLIEAARPVLGARSPYGDRCTGDLPILRAAGLRLAMLAHGSDVRLPSDHLERYPWSPFANLPADQRRTLEYNATANRELMREHDGPVYVSTPDLLDDLPNATWLPVVVDPAIWRTEHVPMERARPVVVHAPSNSAMKGSELIDPVMRRLAGRGMVEYRRLAEVAPAEMPAIYRAADVVLDQFRLGSYGVAACEAMAAGRVVVGHVTDEVRARVAGRTGVGLPIVEATAETLEAVLLALLADRDGARGHAESGVEFVAEVHEGRMAAEALAPFVEGFVERKGRAG